MKAIGNTTVFLFTLAIGFMVGLYGTWISLKLWFWFLVPLGLPAIHFWHLAGVMLSFGMVKVGLKAESYSDKDPDMNWWQKALTRCIGLFLIYNLFWMFGSFYHWMMIQHP